MDSRTAQITEMGRRFLIGWLLAAYVILLTWPMNFEGPRFVENGARFEADGRLTFHYPGIAATPQAPGWASELHDAHQFVLTTSIRSYGLDQSGPARIITYSRSPYSSNLALGQNGSALVLWVATGNSAGDYVVPGHWQPILSVPDVFTDDDSWVSISLQISPEVIRLHVNDRLRGDIQGSEAAWVRWNPSYRLAFGNELTYGRPWLGEISRASVSIDGQTHSYVAPGMRSALHAPTKYLYMQNPPKLIPFRDIDLLDNVVNVLLFLPLGLSLALVRPRGGRLIRDFLFIAGCSLSLECAQLFVASRNPASEDVLLNTLGGWAGLMIGARYRLKLLNLVTLLPLWLQRRLLTE